MQQSILISSHISRGSSHSSRRWERLSTTPLVVVYWHSRPYIPTVMNSSIIDSTTTNAGLVDTLATLPTSPPSLYLDIERINLSRHGSISIIQLFVPLQNHVFLIDVHVLGAAAFSTQNSNGQTLKHILESPDIPKVFFDVRHDSDALYSHFHISLAGIEDIQLLENAVRPFNRRCVSGLAKCIEKDATMTDSQRSDWRRTKEQGLRLFAPERGGSYEVFNARPLSEEIRKYCVQDVLFLPGLWSTYSAKVSGTWAEKIRAATLTRVSSSQTADYNGNGRHMALGPWP